MQLNNILKIEKPKWQKFKWNGSSKQSKYYCKSLSGVSEYSQSDELKPDELEDKPLNSFVYKETRIIKKELIKTERRQAIEVILL